MELVEAVLERDIMLLFKTALFKKASLSSDLKASLSNDLTAVALARVHEIVTLYFTGRLTGNSFKLFEATVATRLFRTSNGFY